jgi:hypothetical protein
VNQYAALGSSIPCGNNIIYIVHQLIIFYPRDAIILLSDLNNDVSITAGEKMVQLLGLVAKFTLVGAVNNEITALVLTNVAIATPGSVSYEAIKGPTVSSVWCTAER